MALTREMAERFAALAGAMSPERLYCDGEMSHAQGVKRWKALRKQWKALECEVGRSVGEGEAIEAAREVR